MCGEKKAKTADNSWLPLLIDGLLASEIQNINERSSNFTDSFEDYKIINLFPA